jgi:hypothetical protein
MEIKPKDRKEFTKLLNEMVDIFNGAYGSYHTVEQWNEELLGVESIANVMFVVNQKYAGQLKEKFRELSFGDIADFDKPAKATKMLFMFGIRAQSNGSEADVAWDMNG